VIHCDDIIKTVLFVSSHNIVVHVSQFGFGSC